MTSAAAASAMLAAPSALPAQPARMRLSHQYPPANHIARVLAAFAEHVTARRAGIEVEVFPAEQLSGAAEHFPGVARGAFEAAVATNFTWGKTIPEMSAPTIPFLFTELGRIVNFPGSEAAGFLDEATARRAVRSVAWLFTTRMSIFSSGRRSILTLADFQGAQDPRDQPVDRQGSPRRRRRSCRHAGAGGRRRAAVRRARCWVTDVSAAVSRRFYEVQRFGVVTPLFGAFTQVYVNPRFWDQLAPPARAALEAGLREAEADAVTTTEATAAAAVGEPRAKGMTIHEQTAEEQAVGKAAMQPPVIEALRRAAPEGGPRSLDLLGALTA